MAALTPKRLPALPAYEDWYAGLTRLPEERTRSSCAAADAVAANDLAAARFAYGACRDCSTPQTCGRAGCVLDRAEPCAPAPDRVGPSLSQVA